MDNLSFQNAVESLLEKEYNEKVEILITKRGMPLDEIEGLRGEIRQIRAVGEMCKRVANELYGRKVG